MSENSSQPSPTSESPWGEDDDLTADLDLGFDGAEDILRTWRRGMRPDPDLTVSEWADQHRWLSSRASAEPGRYRTARTPYLREIMDALSPRHPAQRISFMKAAQVFATAMNVIFADLNMAVDAIWFAGATGPGVAIRVIRKSPDEVTPFGAGRVLSDTTLLDVRLADMPTPAPSDLIRIGLEDFILQGEPKLDRERLTALAVVLNASVVAGVALATYTGTATALNIAFDVLGITGNTFTLAASIAPASNGTVSAATLTGGLNAHTFLSGSWTLPSMSIEVAMPEVPRFAMYSGCVLDSLSWQMERSGLLGAKAMLVAQGETIAGATAAGTPAAITLKRFGHFNGAIKRDGVALGNIVSADLTYANNLDRIETIRSDAKIDGADPTIAALTGKIDVRFADTTLLTQAINGTAAALEFSYLLGSGESLTLTAHAVYLPRPRIEIKGPKGVQASFDWQAALATSPARMCTVVLVNSLAGYP